MKHNINEELLNYLLSFVTEERKNRILNVVSNRTRYITVVIEDIFQSHNISAVLRSAECFGIQDVHIIENQNTFEVNPEIVMGATQWLNIYKYNQKENNSQNTIETLKQKGYKIVATLPSEKNYYVSNIDISNPLAFCFGTEQNGLTDNITKNADFFVKIPMYGFTESYNISVSVALLLNTIVEKIRNSQVNWQLSPEEKIEIALEWVKKSIKRSDLIVKHKLEEIFKKK